MKRADSSAMTWIWLLPVWFTAYAFVAAFFGPSPASSATGLPAISAAAISLHNDAGAVSGQAARPWTNPSYGSLLP